ncbi:putative Transcriptional regulator, TetR family [Deinococcus deserti VCD115]|uniref:Putative Transcriptional regulator, TetR family n=2 Tax=Deinococcus TaxID=1298 RepID=C1CVB2_DEIDV|nr:putative Transcriptional regulator, TetR family [Deinococcus deserti VCD115]
MPFPARLSASSIMDAAWTLLNEGGQNALNMRALAEVLGVRPASLYRHVENREALIRALAERGVLALQDSIALAVQGRAPRDALNAAAHTYLDYARIHPHAYALMLFCDNPAGTTTPDPSPAKALWNTLLKLVGNLSGHPDDTDHAVAFWTFLHGAAMLEQQGLYGDSGPRGGLAVGLTALLDHMEAAHMPRNPSS